MSSECVCHTSRFCFYCEMYLPLEAERDRLAGVLQRIMRTCEKAEAYTTAAKAYHIAYKAIEESYMTRYAIITDTLLKERDAFRRWLETHPDAPPSTIAATINVIASLDALISKRKEDTDA